MWIFLSFFGFLSQYNRELGSFLGKTNIYSFCRRGKLGIGFFSFCRREIYVKKRKKKRKREKRKKKRKKQENQVVHYLILFPGLFF